MADFLNVAVPIANGDLIGGGYLYPWMRVMAGGGTSEFSGIRMRGELRDSAGVLITGGGSGGGNPTSIVWRPSVTPSTDPVIFSGNSTDLNAYIMAHDELCEVFVETSDGDDVVVVNSVVDCRDRVKFTGRRTGLVTPYPVLSFEGQGSFLNPMGFETISLFEGGGSISTMVRINGNGGTKNVSFNNCQVQRTVDHSFFSVGDLTTTPAIFCNIDFMDSILSSPVNSANPVFNVYDNSIVTLRMRESNTVIGNTVKVFAGLGSGVVVLDGYQDTNYKYPLNSQPDISSYELRLAEDATYLSKADPSNFAPSTSPEGGSTVDSWLEKFKSNYLEVSGVSYLGRNGSFASTPVGNTFEAVWTPFSFYGSKASYNMTTGALNIINSLGGVYKIDALLTLRGVEDKTYDLKVLSNGVVVSEDNIIKTVTGDKSTLSVMVALPILSNSTTVTFEIHTTDGATLAELFKLDVSASQMS